MTPFYLKDSTVNPKRASLNRVFNSLSRKCDRLHEKSDAIIEKITVNDPLFDEKMREIDSINDLVDCYIADMQRTRILLEKLED
tara:strand:- start:288 stop:539 length:252 start_codon:yes stop_codon:yes gene_type:complete